jgi:hypothetical protein
MPRSGQPTPCGAWRNCATTFARYATYIASVALLCCGCSSVLSPSSQDVLEKGDTYELMLVHRADLDHAHPAGTFHDCVVEKTVVLSDESSRRRLIAMLRSDLSGHGSDSACRFSPHYGLHITRDGHTLDMLICFHCGQCAVFNDNGHEGAHSIDSEGKATLASIIPD